MSKPCIYTVFVDGAEPFVIPKLEFSPWNQTLAVLITDEETGVRWLPVAKFVPIVDGGK